MTYFGTQILWGSEGSLRLHIQPLGQSNVVLHGRVGQGPVVGSQHVPSGRGMQGGAVVQ